MNLNKHQYPKILRLWPALIRLVWFFRWLLEPRTRLLSRVTSNSVGKRILDLGSGDGLYASKLLGKNIQYTGIDQSQENIDFCKKLFPQFNWLISDIESLDIDISEYDEIWCFSVLPYLNNPSIFLKELECKLNPGTVLTIYAPSHHIIELSIYKYLFEKIENYETLNDRKHLISADLLTNSLKNCKLLEKRKIYGRNGRISHELFSTSLMLFSQTNIFVKILGIVVFFITFPFVLLLGFIDQPKRDFNGLYTEWVRL